MMKFSLAKLGACEGNSTFIEVVTLTSISCVEVKSEEELCSCGVQVNREVNFILSFSTSKSAEIE